MTIPQRLSPYPVACNIYISAGGGGDDASSDFLIQLLQQAQKECTRLCHRQRKKKEQDQLFPATIIHHDSSTGSSSTTATPTTSSSSTLSSSSSSPSTVSSSSSSSSVTIVHAYTDGPYQRSSFHLAGSPLLVTQLATSIAIQAVQQLQQLKSTKQQQEEDDNNCNSNTAHPTVGLVDHISILPLLSPSSSSSFPSSSSLSCSRSNEHSYHPQQNNNDEMSSNDDVFTRNPTREEETTVVLSRDEWRMALESWSDDEEDDEEDVPSESIPPHLLSPFSTKSIFLNDRDDNNMINDGQLKNRDGNVTPVDVHNHSNTDDDYDDDDNSMYPRPITGWVAWTIGRVLQQTTGIKTLYYGYADPPHHTPLAKVRKNRTRFFKTIGSGMKKDTTTSTNSAITTSTATNDDHYEDRIQYSTIGAPPDFVENYNIQIATSRIETAQSLTRWVRSRGGSGLPHVEALTLPYYDPSSVPLEDIDENDDHDSPPGKLAATDGRSEASTKGRQRHRFPVFEVACNLLRPTITSTMDIDQRIQEWMNENRQLSSTAERQTMINHGNDDDDYQEDDDAVIHVRSYRVGTTADMCLEALEKVQTPQGEEEHNAEVLAAFKSLFS